MEEENRQAGEEEKTVGEADNSAKESRHLKEDEEIPVASVEQVDPVNLTEKSSTLSNLRTDDSNHLDVSDSVMKEEEKIVEFPNYTSSVTPEIAQQKNIQSLNKSEGMLLQVPEQSTAETEETNEVIHILDNNESAGSDTATMKSSSASNQDTGDSSSDSDPDSKYFFDDPQPVLSDVEEPENLQDESPESKNEIQVCNSTQKKELRTCSCMKNAVLVSNLINTSTTFSEAPLVPEATHAATNFMEELLWTPRASSQF